jgi:hypothetical protein
MLDGLRTTTYTYTQVGLLASEDGPFGSDMVTNFYSNRLRTGLSLTQPAGAWTNGFAYDAAKRLTNVISPAGTFDYYYQPYLPSRLVQELVLPNTSVPRAQRRASSSTFLPSRRYQPKRSAK